MTRVNESDLEEKTDHIAIRFLVFELFWMSQYGTINKQFYTINNSVIN